MKQDIWQTFGPWLQGERKKAKAPQEIVAKFADVHVVQLSRIENGHSGAKRETVIDLVNAINRVTAGHQIDLEDALRRSGFASSDPMETFNVMDKARLAFLDSSFTDEEQERIVDMMKVLIAGALAGKDQERKK